MKKFKPGDRVCLVIGSDVMTVASVYGSSLVECEWVGKEDKVYKHSFRPESLQMWSVVSSPPQTANTRNTIKT